VSPTPPRVRKRSGPEAGTDLAATLWVLALLIVAFLLAWWLLDGMYAG
jgi:hypothetical protein